MLIVNPTILAPLASTALTLVSVCLAAIGTTVLVAGTIALSRAISKTQALSAWRSAAEGYKEQLQEVQGRLGRAEEASVSLQRRIDELELRPDMTGVVSTLDGKTVEVVGAVRAEGDATRQAIEGVREAVDELSRRMGV